MSSGIIQSASTFAFSVRSITLIPCSLSRDFISRSLDLAKIESFAHFFEKITVPDGVKSIRGGNTANLLRVRDFISETPTSRFHLPASRFFYSICGTDMEEIDPKLCLDGSKALSFEDFETCLAAAAFKPTSMDALLGESDDYWYFLSEVNVNGNKAELSFSIMEAGKDFVQ